MGIGVGIALVGKRGKLTDQLDLFKIENAPEGGHATGDGDQHRVGDSLGQQVVGQKQTHHATAPDGASKQRGQNDGRIDCWLIPSERQNTTFITFIF